MDSQQAEVARAIISLDGVFLPQAKRVIASTRSHSHQQLLTSNYIYQRGILLGHKAAEKRLITKVGNIQFVV